ncbi:CBS domain-containing protein [candidate division GN15 bacterium]|nr:CBS domain-containing protein [candidate division GN15 bacterium]
MTADWIALLMVVIGYFLAYGTSLYAISMHIDPDEIRQLIPKVSNRRRRFLERLSQDPRAFVQTAMLFRSLALIAITGCSIIVLQSLAQTLAVRTWIVLVLGLTLVWLLFVYFVEYLPRRASRKSISSSMNRHFWLVSILYTILLPVVRAYRALLLRGRTREVVSEEEKEDIVERAIETLAEEAGIDERIVEEDEKEMIGQIFLLDQTIVREIMIPRIHMTAINRNMTFPEIRELVAKDGHSRYPVYEDSIDAIVGLIYVKDLFNRMPQPGERFAIDDYLREPYFVPETKVIGELLREFRFKSLHIAVVVDEYGGVAGLVTLEDIIEEIVGEIRDEHDYESDMFSQLPDGRYKVSASMSVEELQELMAVEYDQGDNDTVGGLIYDLVGSVPNEGQLVHWHDIQFEVSRVEGQRIVDVLVRR